MKHTICRFLAVLLCLALLLTGCASKETTWQEQYDLGVRYLSEGNYDEAILAFQAAIEIDPKNPQAYIGVGDAYMGLATQSNDAAEKQEYLLNAKDWYEQAKDLGDESAQDKIDQIEEELNELEQPQGGMGSTGLTKPVEGLTALTQEHFDYAEEFRNGYAFAIQGIDCGYIDTEGNFTVYYQREDPVADEGFGVSDYVLWQYLNSDHQQMWVSEEGLFPMYDRETGLWGYGDIHTGAMVISPAYVDACPFSEGRAVVRKVIMPEQGGNNLNNGIVADGQGGRARSYAIIIDASGNELFTAYDMLITNNTEEIAYQDGTLWVVGTNMNDESNTAYLLDVDGNVLKSIGIDGMGTNYGVHGSANGYALYGGYSRGDANHMAIQEVPGGEVFYIDPQGNVTARMPENATTASLWPEGESAAYYGQNNLWGIFNATGAVTDPIWISANYLSCGIAAATENGDDWYLVDEQGNRVSENVYESAGKMSADGLIAVQQGGLWGYADMSGTIVIPCQFTYASAFSEGIASVRYSEEVYTLINNKGEDVTGDIQALQRFTCEEGFYLIQEEEGWRHIYHAS